ncbi:MAG: NADH-quinone oxidoreductase subunit C [Gammaproteobacteria bacterium]
MSKKLIENLQTQCGKLIEDCVFVTGEVTIEVVPQNLRELCLQLRDGDVFQFDTLLDVCGVDYADYGLMEWATDKTTATGFSRAVEQGRAKERLVEWNKPRFAVVYHLLSTSLNQRVRLKTFCNDEPPMVETVIDIWRSADWFEREAFDLYGILFKGHPDLRRILTDYGFIGHPFRKDFPLSGRVEMRYDATQQRVIYEPVDIEPRVLVPKVGRADSRYADPGEADD